MKDIIVRAAKTFVQAAIGYICTISFVGFDWSDKTLISGVLISALSAGVSALMNVDWSALSAKNNDNKE